MRHQQQAEDHAEKRADIGGQVAGLAQSGQSVETPGQNHGKHNEAQFGAPPGWGSDCGAHVVAGEVNRGVNDSGGPAAAWAACFSATSRSTYCRAAVRLASSWPAASAGR